MSNRILIAAVAGGLTLFFWSFISHMFLGLGSVGVSGVANEDVVLESARTNVKEAGFYFLPYPEGGPNASEAAMKAAEAKAQNGAVLMIYQPHGNPFGANLLLTELASNIVMALLAAFILSQIAGSLAFRALLVALMGLIAGLDVYISYWNWYKFPTNYTMGVMADQVIGFLLMGIVIAAIVKRQPSA